MMTLFPNYRCVYHGGFYSSCHNSDSRSERETLKPIKGAANGYVNDITLRRSIAFMNSRN